jgi:tetratricopeptide (TPR) repeat protein
MSDSTSQSLAAAYQQVEAGNLEEARNIVESIIRSDADNADAWWIYAHAVEDEDEAQEALENVLRIDPDYPGAAELLSQSRGDEDTFEDDLFTDLDQMDTADDFEIDEGDFEDDFDIPTSAETAQEESSGRNRLPLLLIPVVVLLVAVVAFLLFQGGDDDEEGTPEPTQVAQVSDEETPEAETTEAVTEEPAETAEADSTVSITSALEEDFTLASDQPATVQDNELGSTEVIAVCLDGDQRESLDDVMSALTEIDLTSTQSDAIGVQLVDCSTDEVINLIAVSVEDIQQFSDEEISEQEFQGRWRAIG